MAYQNDLATPPKETNEETNEGTKTPQTAPARQPTFEPSQELGASLQQLQEEQVEIDRRETERLAGIRALQDRD